MLVNFQKLLMSDLWDSWEKISLVVNQFLRNLSKVKYSLMKFGNVPTAYVLLNSDLGSDESIITEVKGILEGESEIKYEVQGVYGVYDIVLKLTADDTNILRSVITNKIRKIGKVQSTLTMMVIEEQENL